MDGKIYINRQKFLSIRYQLFCVWVSLLKFLHRLDLVERIGMGSFNMILLALLAFNQPSEKSQLIYNIESFLHQLAATLSTAFLCLLFFRKSFKIDPLNGMPTITLKMIVSSVYSINPLLEIRKFDHADFNGQIQILGELWEIGFAHFKHDNINNRRIIFRKWALKNPDIFRIIYFNNSPVGYFVVMPMSHGTNNAHYLGETKITDVTGDYILPQGQKSELIHLQCLYVLKAYRLNEMFMTLVVKNMLETIVEFIPYKQDSKRPFKNVTIYSECFTKPGTDLLKALGFSYSFRKSALHYKIVELKMPSGSKNCEEKIYDSLLTVEYLKKLTIENNEIG
ncbi:MAG: hypothetical protein P4L41_12350 [Flavipsychrobacter sp.]|nr:hypothetical protein [Flavipsychrobacter sp.]